MTDGEEVILARDAVGVKQLYIDESEEGVAFASEKKALWKIGMEGRRIPPGCIVKLGRPGRESKIKIKKVLGLKVRRGRRIENEERALKAYQKSLVEAVKKRTEELDRAGIIFSGGVDSVLVAKLASNFTEVKCYTAGVEGSSDVEYARAAAERMGFELEVRELNLRDVEKCLPEVIRAIEDRSFNQVEVAIPVYASVELASRDVKVMLTGQGADELFGGYPWYRSILEKLGRHEMENYMVKDLEMLYRETLEREDKITMAHSIELRVPYLDPGVIDTAFRIDSRLKVRDERDELGKYIHRLLACRLGVERSIAFRPKEAAQHGSGMHDVLVEIARKNGFDEELVRELNYSAEKSIEERLGSSVRYGYLFSKGGWRIPDFAQLYLDCIALETGVLKEELSEVAEIVESAGVVG